MSALVLVLILYNLPRFYLSPGDILPVTLLIIISLVLDAAAHLILYKRPVCAVSAAVTALILFTLSPGAPFWAECAALAAALIIGKAVWGGTGKNPLNPAMAGFAFLMLLIPLEYPVFRLSGLLLPAVFLSLPFLFIRPYAGLGMITGMLLSLVSEQNLTAEAVLESGVFFWGCLVITDPVTTTAKPFPGLMIGLLAGFAPGLTGSPAAMPVGILISNLLSFMTGRLDLGPNEKLRKKFCGNQKIRLSGESAVYIDLSGENDAEDTGEIPSADVILRRIENSGVFGMGGAAFSTAQKIKTVMASEAPDKHLIVNAAECDPGLLHDKWLLSNRTKEITKGIEILRKCVPFKSVTVAAKSFDGVRFPEPVRSYTVNDFYPAGAETLLVGNILKGAPKESIPAECGILVLNVQTVYAICGAVLSGRRADTRLLTIADVDSRRGKVVRVRLGAGVYETVLKVLPRAVNVYTGGGIMNACLAGDEAVINEKTNFLAIGRIAGFREALCSRCDFCSAYCPAFLHVREIAHLIDENKPDKAALLHPEKCMACALCSAVCPAGRDQAKRVKAAKNHIANAQTLC